VANTESEDGVSDEERENLIAELSRRGCWTIATDTLWLLSRLAAVTAERDAARKGIEELGRVAHEAIEYVGMANYRERQETARRKVEEAIDAALAAPAGEVNE
jgi:hypothetical protein